MLRLIAEGIQTKTKVLPDIGKLNSLLYFLQITFNSKLVVTNIVSVCNKRSAHFPSNESLLTYQV